MTPRGVTRPPRVLIAGAAGGVGLACAESLGQYRAELILCDIDGVGLTQAGERLQAFTRYCDAIDDHSVEIFADEIAERYPSIDVLINAAGRGYIRALAMLRMTRAFMPLLRRGSGRRLLINVAPAGGFVATTGMFPYASSRRSFHGLSDALREQVRGTSIDVVDVTPRLLRVNQPKDCSEDRLYRLQRIDEQDAARQVVGLIDSAPGLGGRRRAANRGRASGSA
jgi:short-subunit dehydrogenase involved in D-alanine esterification of teichoic acids